MVLNEFTTRTCCNDRPVTKMCYPGTGSIVNMDDNKNDDQTVLKRHSQRNIKDDTVDDDRHQKRKRRHRKSKRRQNDDNNHIRNDDCTGSITTGSGDSSNTDNTDESKKKRKGRSTKKKKHRRSEERWRREEDYDDYTRNSLRQISKNKHKHKTHKSTKEKTTTTGSSDHEPSHESATIKKYATDHKTDDGNADGINYHVPCARLQPGQSTTNPTSEVGSNESTHQNHTNKSTMMKPMTREEYEQQQSQVRQVYDPGSGRIRLVRGSGEIIESIVSRSQHTAINQMATQSDGQYFTRHVFSNASANKR